MSIKKYKILALCIGTILDIGHIYNNSKHTPSHPPKREA
jgi:hypothetical protein